MSNSIGEVLAAIIVSYFRQNPLELDRIRLPNGGMEWSAGGIKGYCLDHVDWDAIFKDLSGPPPVLGARDDG